MDEKEKVDAGGIEKQQYGSQDFTAMPELDGANPLHRQLKNRHITMIRCVMVVCVGKRQRKLTHICTPFSSVLAVSTTSTCVVPATPRLTLQSRYRCHRNGSLFGYCTGFGKRWSFGSLVGIHCRGDDMLCSHGTLSCPYLQRRLTDSRHQKSMRDLETYMYAAMLC